LSRPFSRLAQFLLFKEIPFKEFGEYNILNYLPTPVFASPESSRLAVPGVGLLLRASRYRQVNRLAMRPRGSGPTIQCRL